MTTNEGGGKMIKTTKTAFDIIEFLRKEDGADLTAVSEEIDLARSTAHAHLQSLLNSGFVAKEDGQYYLSLRFLDLGNYVQNRKEGYRIVREKTEMLADNTGERAQFFVEEHGLGVYLAKATGEHAIPGDPGVGKRAYLHTTAGGKAILAHLPRSKAEELLAAFDLARLTQHTITDPDVLLDELDQIADQGYAINKEEALMNLHAVAVPVTNPDDSVLGAFSISGPSKRMDDSRLNHELPKLLLGVAEEVELTITHGQ